MVWSFVLFFNLCANSHIPYFKELIGGYTIGVVGWCVGVNLGNAVLKDVIGDEAIPITGYLLYGIGSSTGVWLVGKQYNGGNYLCALRWSFGFPLAVMGVAMVCGIQLTTANKLIWGTVPIGSFIGYNLRIKKTNTE